MVTRIPKDPEQIPPIKDLSKVTIVVPARNEELTIEDVLLSVKPYAGQILVVDGHSTDKTVEIARKHGADVIQDNRKGKGDAIRCSIPHIKGEVVVFIDADGSHDARDIPALVAPILSDQVDHVTASRMLGGSSELHGGFDEFLRLTGSSFITACINWKFGVRISDSQNGFRSIRTRVLAKLGLKSDITTIEQEMIMNTLHLGYSLGEIPSHEYVRAAGESKIRLTKVWWAYGWSLFYGMIRPRIKA